MEETRRTLRSSSGESSPGRPDRRLDRTAGRSRVVSLWPGLEKRAWLITDEVRPWRPVHGVPTMRQQLRFDAGGEGVGERRVGQEQIVEVQDLKGPGDRPARP
jgi:hypothetical protein